MTKRVRKCLAQRPHISALLLIVREYGEATCLVVLGCFLVLLFTSSGYPVLNFVLVSIFSVPNSTPEIHLSGVALLPVS